MNCQARRADGYSCRRKATTSEVEAAKIWKGVDVEALLAGEHPRWQPSLTPILMQGPISFSASLSMTDATYEAVRDKKFNVEGGDRRLVGCLINKSKKRDGEIGWRTEVVCDYIEALS
jgi:hypothetical protein